MSLLLTFMDLDRLYENKASEWLFTGKAKVPQYSERSGRSFELSNLTVHGKTEAEALKNVKYTVRMRNNLPNNTPLVLYDYVICEKSEIIKKSDNKTCYKCNTLLTDGSSCPVCDDGEERY